MSSRCNPRFCLGVSRLCAYLRAPRVHLDFRRISWPSRSANRRRTVSNRAARPSQSNSAVTNRCEPWSVEESKPTASSPLLKSLVFSRQLFLRPADVQTTLLRVGEVARNDLSNGPLVGLIVAKETDNADLRDPFRRKRDIE